MGIVDWIAQRRVASNYGIPLPVVKKHWDLVYKTALRLMERYDDLPLSPSG